MNGALRASKELRRLRCKLLFAVVSTAVALVLGGMHFGCEFALVLT